MKRLRRSFNLLSEEEREIDKIQKDVILLNEMFREMDEIVNYQGFALTTIEDEFGNVIVDVVRGNTEIQTTEINIKRIGKIGIVVGLLTGTATGIGIPLALMLGIKAVIIGGVSGGIGGTLGGAIISGR